MVKDLVAQVRRPQKPAYLAIVTVEFTSSEVLKCMLSDSDAGTNSAELVSCMNMDYYIIERSCPVWTLNYYLYCPLLFWFAGQVDLGSNSPQFSNLSLASCVALI